MGVFYFTKCLACKNPQTRILLFENGVFIVLF